MMICFVGESVSINRLIPIQSFKISMNSAGLLIFFCGFAYFEKKSCFLEIRGV